MRTFSSTSSVCPQSFCKPTAGSASSKKDFVPGFFFGSPAALQGPPLCLTDFDRTAAGPANGAAVGTKDHRLMLYSLQSEASRASRVGRQGAEPSPAADSSRGHGRSERGEGREEPERSRDVQNAAARQCAQVSTCLERKTMELR